MKGQYLAVESVLTLGLGIVVATGTVSAFTVYREELMDTAVRKQVDTVESELSDAVYGMKDAESGEREVDLPEKIGGDEYRVILDDGVRIIVNEEHYTTEFSGLKANHEFKGAVEGGSVKIFKRDKQYTLRAD